jgi:hypothetical protein
VDIGGNSVDLRHLTADIVFASHSKSLFEHLAKLAPSEVLQIDLGNGREWLTSRLYLFSALLERLRGIRCVAILRTKEDRNSQAVGSMSPAAICATLAADEPWLEQTYASAWHEVFGVVPAAPIALGNVSAADVTFPKNRLDSETAQQVAQAFIRLSQRFTEPIDRGGEWQSFEPPHTGSESITVWEHTQWIDPAALPKPLSRALDTTSVVQVDPTERHNDLKRRILLQEGPFVMLVERDGTLRGMADRASMLDQAIRAGLGVN